MRPSFVLSLLSLAHNTYALRWFSLTEKSASSDPSTHSLALYPLPAVYLPGSTCTLKNIEPRNVAMAREQSTFVASLLDNDRKQCAEIAAVLRIDDVRAASADTSGRVLASCESSTALQVQCTVLGRARLIRCDNLAAWETRETYLIAEVSNYDDDDVSTEDTQLQNDVEDAVYRLVDALLEGEENTGIDVHATVDALEEAALHVSSGCWWEALELWQRHCSTRAMAMRAEHLTERNEFLIDAKLRQGGMLQIPVQEHTLPAEDRKKLLDLDQRAAEALDQMGLDDVETFQACLEARSTTVRAKRLLEGVLREAGRLERRLALQRALKSS